MIRWRCLLNDLQEIESLTPKHNYNNCCSFCKLEKLVTQKLRRIAYGRAETPSARNLVQ